jgi:hypothetical protein
MRGSAQRQFIMDDSFLAALGLWLGALAAETPDLTAQLDGGWQRQVTVTVSWDHVRVG